MEESRRVVVQVALHPVLPSSNSICEKLKMTSDKMTEAGFGAGTFPVISPGSCSIKLLCAGQEDEQQTPTKCVAGRACTETLTFCVDCISNA